jgi:serum/glucocorticoid-regulated kinase 2
MEYVTGGELFKYLNQYSKFTEETTQFYAAEVFMALDYLHKKLDTIYRDLKPENILIDSNGHIKLVDFGLSHIGVKANSFCGTPEYIAPEILERQGYNKMVDYWCLGA